MNNSDINFIIEAGNSAWNHALNTGDTKGLAELYAENATLSAGDGKRLVGRSEIENLFKGFVKNGVHNHTLEIIKTGGDDKVIYQVSRWNAYGAEADGNKLDFTRFDRHIIMSKLKRRKLNERYQIYS
jgi:ketosteroid isomerase-like protein